MELKQEIEKGSDYEEGCQGKGARYNTPTEETSMNTLNNKQASTVRVPPNYSQVLQAPAPTDVQIDIDLGRKWSGTVPILAKTTTTKGNHGKHGNNTAWGKLATRKRN